DHLRAMPDDRRAVAGAGRATGGSAHPGAAEGLAGDGWPPPTRPHPDPPPQAGEGGSAGRRRVSASPGAGEGCRAVPPPPRAGEGRGGGRRMSVAIRRAAVEDAGTVSTLAARTFTETFGHLYPPEDLAAFLQDAYA